MPWGHEALHKLLPWCYSFSIRQLVLMISVPFVHHSYLHCELSEAKKYYVLIWHLILWFWLEELSALKHNIIHNLKSRISLGMIKSFILSVQAQHITVNKLRDHQKPMTYYTTICDVLSNRTCKSQEARLHFAGLAGSSSGVDFKSLYLFFL